MQSGDYVCSDSERIGGGCYQRIQRDDIRVSCLLCVMLCLVHCLLLFAAMGRLVLASPSRCLVQTRLKTGESSPERWGDIGIWNEPREGGTAESCYAVACDQSTVCGRWRRSWTSRTKQRRTTSRQHCITACPRLSSSDEICTRASLEGARQGG